jgi:gelsolin
MSGLVKPKEYNWKDSNLEFFGSDTEKEVKKESALAEPAWQNAGTEVGLQIWRIMKFQVEHWDKDLYGKFFNGDSYIVLNTYKPDPNSQELAYDLHFWIGANSSQDEYGTAAYKTVELDTYLDDKPVQHRECEGYESDQFLSYFKNGFTIMEGGADSGFRHVEPEKYVPRLLHFHGTGKKNIVVNQVPAARSRLNSDDVFILDMGLTIYQWNGSGANTFEKTKAMGYLNNLKVERSGKAIVTDVVDEDSSGVDESHPFYAALQAEDVQITPVAFSVESPVPELFRISDEGGSLEFSHVKTGAIERSELNSNDVFIVDTPKTCFVWIGSGASPAESKNGFGYAHNHLMKTSNPLRSIVVVKEGQENQEFKAALAA